MCDTTTESSGTVQSNDTKSASPLDVDGSTKSPQTRQQLKEQVAALAENCKSVAKITPEQAKIATNQAVPKTEAEKCFLGCIYDGIGLAKDGQFNEAGARSLAQLRFGSSPDELGKANTMIEACAKEAVAKDSSEKCAIGRLLRECFLKNGAKDPNGSFHLEIPFIPSEVWGAPPVYLGVSLTFAWILNY
ncbi:hypothetical protein AAG570_004432 [Ranatra chinensis]|uniref:Uncharacterized protein n=1 Tax=Ranatra chinensis TaxID=642074 RepID=A0ABD0YMM4_9HEMI